MAILHANGNRNHGSRAELACGVRWNRRHKAAIRKTPRANLHRFEQAGEGAACPNRVHQVSLGEDYWLAGRQICSHYGKRNLQIFELARTEHALDERAEALVARKTQPRHAPPRDVAEAHRPADLDNALERRAARISRAEDAAHAAARDVGHSDLALLQDFQDAKVRKSPRKAPTQGQSDAWPLGRCPCPRVHLLLRRMVLRLHGEKDARRNRFGLWPGRPADTVRMYFGGGPF